MSALPALRGLSESYSIEAISRPARTFTGDFYFTHRADDRLWLAMATWPAKACRPPSSWPCPGGARAAHHRLRRNGLRPSRTMQRLHEFLLPSCPATASPPPSSPTSTTTHAHHRQRRPLSPAYCSTRWHDRRNRLHGPLLGILAKAAWHTYTTRLEQGETLILYSDGVTESTRNDVELGVC